MYWSYAEASLMLNLEGCEMIDTFKSTFAFLVLTRKKFFSVTLCQILQTYHYLFMRMETLCNVDSVNEIAQALIKNVGIDAIFLMESLPQTRNDNERLPFVKVLNKYIF